MDVDGGGVRRDWLPRRRPDRRWRRWLLVAAVTLVGGGVLVEAAVPNFCITCGPRRGESAAVATLKNIAHAQRQFCKDASCDVDGDGVGEHGFLAELAGALPLRANAERAAVTLATPLLTTALGKVHKGRIQRIGYLFQLSLPGVGGVWIPEASHGGGIGAGVDANGAELDWLCYAWPVVHGETGKRAFAITSRGDVLASDLASEVYSGDFGPMAGVAAFVADGGRLVLAANTTDLRGNVWVVIQ